jgi:hypothetical protein
MSEPLGFGFLPVCVDPLTSRTVDGPRGFYLQQAIRRRRRFRRIVAFILFTEAASILL